MPPRNTSVWGNVDFDLGEAFAPNTVLSDTELEALKRAGRDAGGFLMETGTTDMAKLTKEQWTAFTARLILSFEAHMAGFQNGNAA